MARGGVNKAIVQKAREALLARGENPSIDAVRVELGNTGSKTTIHRYLKELDEVDQRRKAPQQGLSDELNELVARVAQRLAEEGKEQIEQALAASRAEKSELLEQLQASQDALRQLQQQFDIQCSALDTESAELQTCRTTLQAEQTRNARLSQSNLDIEVRLKEKDEQIRSLEEKHLHARDALEHYRGAIKEQREQEQRRHEGQLQQIQMELRHLQQTLIIKQDELTQLNRDNERLLTEARQQQKAYLDQELVKERQTGEINSLKTLVAQGEGGKQVLLDQVSTLQHNINELADALEKRSLEANELAEELDAARATIAKKVDG
ncbi:MULTISPECIES: DNA-binding protein [unclassified Pseudomonas]|uniref:DNA-binding protein n=1 Tax=unclassified Pseudomonas TaxID=196821 RepID=UPI000CD0C8A9|nr:MULTISPECIES: DNA-binding protein [unclassified Pseudomonas]POA35823.1 integrase [Pseudomonas sp. GW456-R21]POA71596.1 integrase [Pseudomonas sp. GW460-R15]